jgi:hypothetical protein
VDDIARLLEGRLEETERAKILTHLETCRQCVEVYLDSAVEVGFLRIDGPLSSKKTRSLVGLGMQVPAQVEAAERARGGGPERVSAPGFWAGWRVRAVAVAASVVFIVAAAWYGARVFEQLRSSRVSSEILQPIQAAVGEFSRVGEVVLPGGESYLGGSGPVFRSLGGGLDDSIAVPLKDLLEKFLAGSRSPDVAYWLVAGYLSSGDVRTASIYVAAARERFPDDRRLIVLEGVVAYFGRDLARSERLLRDVVKSHVSDPLADPLLAVAQLNLAIVLRDQGNLAEAREILRSVAQRHAGEPIGERAGAVGAALGG